MVHKVLDVSSGGGSESHRNNCTPPLPPKKLVAPVLRTQRASGQEGRVARRSLRSHAVLGSLFRHSSQLSFEPRSVGSLGNAVSSWMLTKRRLRSSSELQGPNQETEPSSVGLEPMTLRFRVSRSRFHLGRGLADAGGALPHPPRFPILSHPPRPAGNVSRGGKFNWAALAGTYKRGRRRLIV